MTFAISGLTAGYGRLDVLRDVDMEPAEAGQLVGVIGPNASGKSTLFKSISGIVRPRAGRIVLNGENLVDISRPKRARLVAYMPQSFGCNAALSVFESVLLALKQNGGWRVRRENLTRVEDTLAMLNLAHLGGRGLSELSGGQAQMVAVAQTLVRDPKLVLLDEPTSALDLHHQLSILSCIRDAMKKRGMIVMAALHDLNLAAQFCDRIVLIGQGEILADGAPDDILARPAIDAAYRVSTHLEHTARGTLYVDAHLGG